MNVVLPSHCGDIALRDATAELLAECGAGSRHDVTFLHRAGDGSVETLGAKFESGWPRGPTQMFKALVTSRRVGDVFFWCEPDCCPTRRTSLDELEAAARALFDRWPRLCVVGHWKTPPVTPDAPVPHYSGCSVYRCTPEFKAAVAQVRDAQPFDLQLFFRGLLLPDQGCDTPLIRCMWGQPVMPRRVLAQVPGAAFVHGDKHGKLLEHVRPRFFAAAATQ